MVYLRSSHFNYDGHPKIRTSSLLCFVLNAVSPLKSGHLSDQDTLSLSQKCPHLGVPLQEQEYRKATKVCSFSPEIRTPLIRTPL